MKTTKVKSCSSCIDNLAKKKECINKIKQIQLMTERYTLFIQVSKIFEIKKEDITINLYTLKINFY